MKLVAIAALVSVVPAFAQIDPARARQYFEEASTLCQREGGKTWGVSLCGPMFMVDLTTRAVVANQPTPSNRLPDEMFPGNAAVDWGGTRWTMLMWQLIPHDDAAARARLFAHEMWHRVQNGLGLRPGPGTNAHLETLEGRYWMQLEWRALADALTASGDDRTLAMADALAFRGARRKLAATAADEERAIEMNEGLASYTGVIAAAASRPQAIRDAVDGLEGAAKRDSFVRWFAYASGPAYGLLLDEVNPDWRKDLTPESDLGALLLILPDPGPETAAERYGGIELMAAERRREAEFQKRADAYRAKLIDGPVLTLEAGRVARSNSNTNGMMVLPGAGTVFTTFRTVDEWGTLEVTNGAILTADRKYVVAASPKREGRPIKGEGWTLTLQPGWVLAPGPRAGDFVVTRAPAR